MALYEDLHSRRCRYPIGWFKVGETSIFSPDFIYKTLEKVHIKRNLLQTTYCEKKSYVNHSRRDLELEEGDKV